MKTPLIKTGLFMFLLSALLTINVAIAAQAPDFKLKGQGKTVQLSKYKGQIVYVDFWASWCQPCRKSFGWMNRMQSRYGNDGLKIIAINLDESTSKAKKFLKKLPADFAVAFDPKGRTAESYHIKAMPSSFIIDQNGNVVHANLGFHANDEDKLEAKIRKLLRNSTVASR